MTSGVVSGMTTTTRNPARAPYAAHAAPALPAVGRASAVTPSSRARVTPTAAPRALNVPVGRRPSSLTRSRAFDLGAKSAEAGIELLVPAVDLLDPTHDARALRAERRRKQCHASADIGTTDLGGVKLARPDHHGAVRIRQNDPRAHLT